MALNHEVQPQYRLLQRQRRVALLGCCALDVALAVERGGLGIGILARSPAPGADARGLHLADITAPRFAERDLWNIRRDRADHSALMLAARITLAHLSVWSASHPWASLGRARYRRMCWALI